MKRYTILSVFILLVACAGGGNNSKSNLNDLTPIQSNKLITGMLEGKDSNGDNLKLESVQFTSSDSIVENQNNYISFKMNTDGKIEGLRTFDKDTNREIDDELVKNLKRINDSNIFVSNLSVFEFDPSKSGIELIKDEAITYAYTLGKLKEELKKKVEEKHPTDEEKRKAFDKIETLTSESIGIKKDKKHKLEIVQKMYGKDIGLKYSDFGFLDRRFKEQQDNKEYELIENKSGLTLIAGGFDERNIDKGQLTGIIEFKGKAVGKIENKNKKNSFLSLEDKEAKLTFNQNESSEKLEMNFSNWYKVEVNAKNGNNTITFTNPNGNIINQDLQLDENSPDNVKKFETKYYGVNGKASESVGYVEYIKEDGIIKKVFQASFGAKAD